MNRKILDIRLKIIVKRHYELLEASIKAFDGVTFQILQSIMESISYHLFLII